MNKSQSRSKLANEIMLYHLDVRLVCDSISVCARMAVLKCAKNDLWPIRLHIMLFWPITLKVSSDEVEELTKAEIPPSQTFDEDFTKLTYSPRNLEDADTVMVCVKHTSTT